MKFINKGNIEIVDVFIHMYGKLISDVAPHYAGDIEFKILTAEENGFGDIMGRVGNTVFYSPDEVSRIGLTPTETLAVLAHEIGHIVYSTSGWQPDCEQRADTFAAELGLGNQMIGAIEKIIDSRRFRSLSSALVGRIHYLQNLARG